MPQPSLLSRLGLDRPELRAWAMYDWAASSVQTTIMVAVFPIYFVKVAGAGMPESAATQRLATINSIALVIIALLSPVLGAVSDYGAAKKRFTAGFMVVGVIATAGLTMVHTGDLELGSWLFILVLVVAGLCSTRRCCPTSPARRRSTESRRRGTPWDTWGAGCCSR
jgi:UMF1 family MFS transporter